MNYKCKHCPRQVTKLDSTWVHLPEKVTEVDGHNAEPNLIWVFNSIGKPVYRYIPKGNEGKKQRDCNNVCQTSMSSECSCSCGGLNHGIKTRITK